MGIVHTWSRQVARAAGASLIAPLVLLVAAGVLASGGSLGGLGSLGQIASGPSLPDTGLTTASSSSIKGAEIVGTTPRAPSEPVGSTPPGAQIASATPPPAAPSPPAAEAAAPPPATEFGSRAQGPTQGSSLTDTTGGTVVEGPAGRRPTAVEELQETTSGLGESLSQPLEPVANQLLDLLRLLTPRR